MAVGCGAKFSKMLLFIFNFCFWGCGVALIVCGSIVLAGGNVGDIAIDDSDALLTAGAALIITAGCLTFVVGFFGCCGAWKENKCMLGTYFTCLAILCIIQITVGVLAIVYKNDISDTLAENTPKTLQENYGAPDMTSFTEEWDRIQKDQECCGYNSSDDYTGNEHLDQGWSFPKSCCVLNEQGEIVDETKCKNEDAQAYNHKGCSAYVNDLYEEWITLLVVLGFIIAAVEIVGMVFTCCLYCNTEK